MPTPNTQRDRWAAVLDAAKPVPEMLDVPLPTPNTQRERWATVLSLPQRLSQGVFGKSDADDAQALEPAETPVRSRTLGLDLL